MVLLLFVGLLVVAITLIYIYLKRRFILLGNGVPGMEPQIIVGNFLNSGLLSGKITFHEILYGHQRQYGDKFIFWFGSTPNFVFCLPQHAKEVFSDRQRFEQSPLFLPNFDLMCPANLTILTGERYKRHARIMLPAFKRAKVIQHIDTIIECTDRFIQQYLEDNEVHTDLVNQCQILTMNVFGLIAFDYDIQNYRDSGSKVPIPDLIFHTLFIMFLSCLPRWMVSIYIKLNWRLQRIHRQIRELMEKIVEHEQNNLHTTEQRRPRNLIASLVSSLNEEANDEHTASGLTREEMFDEVILAMIAGYETIASTISWFIFYMSKYPHIQDRIKQELREHDLLMTNDVQCLPAITQEKLDALVYCECVTKEVRFYDFLFLYLLFDFRLICRFFACLLLLVSPHVWHYVIQRLMVYLFDVVTQYSLVYKI